MTSALAFTLEIDSTETVESASATGSDPSGQTVKLMATKRFGGTPGFNPSASMLTANVQFDGNAKGTPPANLTLQGVHDIASGNETGSVSAASPELSEYIGGTFTFDAKVLLLTIYPRATAQQPAHVPESPRAAAAPARG
jgi:hypothetical protein